MTQALFTPKLSIVEKNAVLRFRSLRNQAAFFILSDIRFTSKETGLVNQTLPLLSR